MNKVEKKIVFIIPTYNRYKELDKTLTQFGYIFKEISKSPNFSTIKSFLYISDNYSTDKTSSIVKKHQKISNLNILYIKRKSNLGPVENHFLAINEMDKFEILSIWGDDDDIEFEYIKEIFLFAKSGKRHCIAMQAPILKNKKYHLFNKEALLWYSSFSLPGLTFTADLISLWPSTKFLKYPQTLFVIEVLLNNFHNKLIPMNAIKSRINSPDTFMRMKQRGSLDYCFTERISYFNILISYQTEIKKANLLKNEAYSVIIPEISHYIFNLMINSNLKLALRSFLFIAQYNSFNYFQKFKILFYFLKRTLSRFEKNFKLLNKLKF